MPKILTTTNIIAFTKKLKFVDKYSSVILKYLYQNCHRNLSVDGKQSKKNADQSAKYSKPFFELPSPKPVLKFLISLPSAGVCRRGIFFASKISVFFSPKVVIRNRISGVRINFLALRPKVRRQFKIFFLLHHLVPVSVSQNYPKSVITKWISIPPLQEFGPRSSSIGFLKNFQAMTNE